MLFYTRLLKLSHEIRDHIGIYILIGAYASRQRRVKTDSIIGT